MTSRITFHRIAISFLVALAGFCFWQAMPKQTSQHVDSGVASPLQATVMSSSRCSSAPAIQTRLIEQVRVGQRVFAHNPEITGEEREAWEDEPDFASWFYFKLEMPKPDGSILTVDLLRPEEWVRSQLRPVITESQRNDAPSLTDSVRVDQTYREVADADSSRLPLHPLVQEIVFVGQAAHLSGAELIGLIVELDLPEMGASGTAVVMDILSAPPIERRTSHRDTRRVVTATFRHPPSTEVIDVSFADDAAWRQQGLLSASNLDTIGVTDNHLFWSVDHQEFRQIGRMEVGQRVLTYSGETKRIANKLPRPGPPAEVYNLEVYGEHVYFVGVQNLLVHNAYEQLGTKAPFVRKNGRWYFRSSIQNKNGVNTVVQKRVGRTRVDSRRRVGREAFVKKNPEYANKDFEFHHSVEWNVLSRFRGTFTAAELNLPSMMRPIQLGKMFRGQKLHRSLIRNSWDEFAYGTNTNFAKKYAVGDISTEQMRRLILRHRDYIDRMYLGLQ